MGKFKTLPATRLSVSENDIYTTGRMKYYLNSEGTWELGAVDFFESKGAFRKKGFEKAFDKVWMPDYYSVHVSDLDEVTYNPITGQDVVKWGYQLQPDEPPHSARKYNTEDGNDKGRRRAMVKLFDYVRCNWDFNCMFTLTFDRMKIDRTSYEDIVKKVGEWLSNRVRRNGLKYLAVPEYHADGESIHIHGVCNFEALKTEWSGKVNKGKRVYNITDFTLGHTAVKRFGKEAKDRHAVSVYVSKYITKDTVKVGGRYYLHGGKLETPRVILCDISREDAEHIADVVPCSVFECSTPMGGTYCKYTVEADEAYARRKSITAYENTSKV